MATNVANVKINNGVNILIIILLAHKRSADRCLSYNRLRSM